MSTDKLHIGLTGGIGSGKSTVATMLVAHGATLIDTDGISRSLTLPGGAAIAPIRHEFGADAIDAQGALDRVFMRSLVFSDPSAKARLESILHPLIGFEVDRQAHAAQGEALVFDVPLLVESPRWRSRVDRVLVVDTREETQVERVMQRSKWARDTVLSVIAQQASRQQRRAAADAVIFNDGLSLDALRAEVEAVWRAWCPSGVAANGST
jgi:dephospho-CoA kinase